MSNYYILSYNRYIEHKLIGAGYMGCASLKGLNKLFDDQVEICKKDYGENCIMADIRITKL